MDHELMYCVVKTSYVWCVIVYQQFCNYDGVIFLYWHVSDSNYCLPIDTETFLFRFIRFRSTGFCRLYSISDFPVSVTDRIKTYTSENGERGFPTVSYCFHPYQRRVFLGGGSPPLVLDECGTAVMSVATPVTGENYGTYKKPNRWIYSPSIGRTLITRELSITSAKRGCSGEPVDGSVSV
jgi:hypothetical protein